jgi:lysophospholipase L1-like esterase
VGIFSSKKSLHVSTISKQNAQKKPTVWRGWRLGDLVDLTTGTAGCPGGPALRVTSGGIWRLLAIMKPFSTALAIVMTVVGLAVAHAANGKKTTAAKTRAPNPAFAQITDVAGLPRVLLIGDSISMGYTVPVRERLEGKANVHRPAENCGDTARGVKSIDKWLGSGKWDVIHFNFGLHDLKYLDATGQLAPPDRGKQVASLAEYEANLRTLVARLKQTRAKLIFATTTPVPTGTTGRMEDDAIPYNAVAVRVMRELGVALNDLHAFVKPRQTQLQLPANVHFNNDGSAQLAETVAGKIALLLPPAHN